MMYHFLRDSESFSVCTSSSSLIANASYYLLGKSLENSVNDYLKDGVHQKEVKAKKENSD